MRSRSVKGALPLGPLHKGHVLLNSLLFLLSLTSVGDKRKKMGFQGDLFPWRGLRGGAPYFLTRLIPMSKWLWGLLWVKR